MKISKPRLNEQAGKARLESAVSFDQERPALPDQIWHDFPLEFADFIFSEADTFVTALLPLAMHLGEDIHVTGPISEKLAYHAVRYQQIMSAWHPDLFRPIAIFSDGFHAGPANKPAPGVATMFSGGVDSFFTLGQHLPENQKNSSYRLTHAIFSHNFDFPPDDPAFILQAIDQYAAFLETKGLSLIDADSNLRVFRPAVSARENISWSYLTFGTLLASIGQALSAGIGRLLIPSSYTFLRTEPIGSDMRTDPLLSTDRLEIIHHGVTETRMQKLQTLVDWPMTHGLLRVCWWDARGVQNCCRCPKCVRTMVSLEILGALPNYSTFARPIRLKDLRRLVAATTYPFTADMFRFALRKRRYKMALFTGAAAFLSGLLRLARRPYQLLFPHTGP